MSTSTWLPPVIVLAAGVIAGIWAALRMRRRKAEAAPEDADLRLEISDLEGRRDALYQRLENAADEGLDAEEIAALETEAASTLRDLDAAKARTASRHPKAAASRKAAKEQPRARGSAIGGFAAGVAMSALVGILVFWAVRDAKPDPVREQMEVERQARAAAANGGTEPHATAELPPVVAQRVASIEARLAADPGDLQARKELAMTLLAVEQYVPAFQNASLVLEQQPDDPDALFIHGVVRVAMNQNAEAIDLLDRVLDRFPQHVYAQMYKGIALARGGQADAARLAWQAGLEAAGGSHPDLEQLLAMADSGAMDGGGQGSGGPVGGGPVGGGQAAPSSAGAPAANEAALVWQAPTDWQAEEPASPMRRAQYRVPGTAGDAELVVFYFGAGQGGDAMANARRWADQFVQADGRPSTEAMETRERNVGDMPVLVVEVEGTYTGGMSGAGELDDAMLLGAIARGPDANWFFKLTGPRATVESQRAAFDSLIGSLRAADSS